MIRGSITGEFKTDTWLKKLAHKDFSHQVERAGREGRDALSAATPVRTGLTAASWDYELANTATGSRLVWKNTNMNKGLNVAVLIDCGHGKRGGGYVPGKHFIKPTLQPIVKDLEEQILEEVKMT